MFGSVRMKKTGMFCEVGGTEHALVRSYSNTFIQNVLP